MAGEFKIKTGLLLGPAPTQSVTSITDSSIFTNDSSTLASVNAIKGYVDTKADASFGLYETKVNLDSSFGDVYDVKVDKAGDTMYGTLDMSVNSIESVKWIDFNLTDSYPHQEGRIHWNDDDKTLEIDTEVSETRIQIGQELILRCTNKTGVSLYNGNIVNVSGAIGNRPTIELADVTTLGKVSYISNVGMVTQTEIANNATGYVTFIGLIRGLNTSAFSEGQIIWLSTTPGAWATSTPDAPMMSVMIGYCVVSHINEGIIWINNRRRPRLSLLSDVSARFNQVDGDVLSWVEDGSYWRISQIPTGIKSYVDSSLDNIKATYIPDVSLSTDFYWNTSNLLEVSTGFGGATIAYVDGSLALRDTSITELYEWVEGVTYDSCIFIEDNQSHQTTISSLDQMLGLLAPAKPNYLTGKTLLDNVSTYSAKLPTGLSLDWYIDASSGDTISSYSIDNTFRLTTPSYSDTFYAGTWNDTNTRGLLTSVIIGIDDASYNMIAGFGDTSISTIDVSGLLRFNQEAGYGGPGTDFWRRAEAYIDVTSQRDGYVSYAIKHSLGLTSNIFDLTYDSNPGSAIFSVSPIAPENTPVNLYLSGLNHYGINSTFNISFTGAAGIFQHAYHSSYVSRLTSTYGSTINITPSSIPVYNDTFIISNKLFTFNNTNQISGSNNGTITTTLYKPNITGDASILSLSKRVNTYSQTRATTTVEYFTDEYRRLLDGSSGSDTTWDETDISIFIANGPYAQTQNGTLKYPVNGDYGISFSGTDKEYIRRFTKSGSGSNGKLTFSGFNPSSYLGVYGSGDVNILMWLTDQNLYFDLGQPFGSGGDGSSRSQAIGGYSGSLGSNYINWTLGTNSLGNETTHTGQFILIIIFRNTNRSITQITLSSL